MSISNTLFTGSSGLIAHGDAIGVVGDNIANTSTVGYKSSRANFADVLGGTGDNGQRFGNGVRMGGVSVRFGQGPIQQTGAPLDMAVRGDGFFVVNGSHDGITSNYYTRDGRFHLDNEGTMVNVEGLHVQGYMIDAQGVASGALSDLKIGGQSPPSATTKLDMQMNLDSASVAPAAFDPVNPGTTSNFTTSATVHDSLGAAHRVDMYFRTSGGGAWEWHAMVDGADVGAAAGTPTEIANGTLQFNPNGALQTSTQLASSASFVGATANQAIAFGFGDPIATGGTGLTGATQFAAASSVLGATQDGFAAGELADIITDADGTINGVFSNGEARPIGKLALASFQSEDGLRRAGSQLFLETRDSGQALVGQAGTGSRGAISSGSVESSNVDLSNELVTMIAYQRAFQANAKTITTADEMLAEVANLKR